LAKCRFQIELDDGPIMSLQDSTSQSRLSDLAGTEQPDHRKLFQESSDSLQMPCTFDHVENYTGKINVPR